MSYFNQNEAALLQNIIVIQPPSIIISRHIELFLSEEKVPF